MSLEGISDVVDLAWLASEAARRPRHFQVAAKVQIEFDETSQMQMVRMGAALCCCAVRGSMLFAHHCSSIRLAASQVH